MDQAKHFTEPNAARLARRIEAFWKSKGFMGIRAWTVPHEVEGQFCERGQRRSIYLVTSNIGPNGFPPLLPESRAAA